MDNLVAEKGKATPHITNPHETKSCVYSYSNLLPYSAYSTQISGICSYAHILVYVHTHGIDRTSVYLYKSTKRGVLRIAESLLQDM